MVCLRLAYHYNVLDTMTTLLFIFLLITVISFASGLTGAPWVPARARDVTALLDDAKVGPQTSYIELGCGDGRLVAAAALRGATAVGYEINPIMFVIAWLRCLFVGKKAKVIYGNFWNKDIGSADVVMAFLMPRTVGRLEQKAEQEMKAGSRLVSYVFALPHRKHTTKGKSWFVYKF